MDATSFPHSPQAISGTGPNTGAEPNKLTPGAAVARRVSDTAIEGLDRTSVPAVQDREKLRKFSRDPAYYDRHPFPADQVAYMHDKSAAEKPTLICNASINPALLGDISVSNAMMKNRDGQWLQDGAKAGGEAFYPHGQNNDAVKKLRRGDQGDQAEPRQFVYLATRFNADATGLNVEEIASDAAIRAEFLSADRDWIVVYTGTGWNGWSSLIGQDETGRYEWDESRYVIFELDTTDDSKRVFIDENAESVYRAGQIVSEIYVTLEEGWTYDINAGAVSQLLQRAYEEFPTAGTAFLDGVKGFAKAPWSRCFNKLRRAMRGDIGEVAAAMGTFVATPVLVPMIPIYLFANPAIELSNNVALRKKQEQTRAQLLTMFRELFSNQYQAIRDKRTELAERSANLNGACEAFSRTVRETDAKIFESYQPEAFAQEIGLHAIYQDDGSLISDPEQLRKLFAELLFLFASRSEKLRDCAAYVQLAAGFGITLETDAEWLDFLFSMYPFFYSTEINVAVDTFFEVISAPRQ